MRRRRRKYRLTKEDKRILVQFREAADRGDFVGTYNRMMYTLMSDRIHQIPGFSHRSEHHMERLRVSIALQLTNMANAVAAEKNLDISFMPLHPMFIFDSGVRT